MKLQLQNLFGIYLYASIIILYYRGTQWVTQLCCSAFNSQVYDWMFSLVFLRICETTAAESVFDTKNTDTHEFALI